MFGLVGLKRESRMLTTTTARWLRDKGEGSSCSLLWTSCGKSVRSPAFRRKGRILPRSKPDSHHLIAHKRIDARVCAAKDVGPIVGREHRGKPLHARLLE